MRVRLLIWCRSKHVVQTENVANRHREAMDLTVALLCSKGYDPDAPENVAVFVPASVADVDILESELLDEPFEENDIRALLMMLICKLCQ